MDEFPLFARFAQKKNEPVPVLFIIIFPALCTSSSPFTTLASVPSMDPGRPTASRVTHFIKYIE
jgi:hypothetical protein